MMHGEGQLQGLTAITSVINPVELWGDLMAKKYITLSEVQLVVQKETEFTMEMEDYKEELTEIMCMINLNEYWKKLMVIGIMMKVEE